ncbi:g2273 [Coccomyxa viridis]|uniref:Protein ZIP4 homolog n=1 Tax=Coccomyxa viridis TaxID=1274662 RepID=A0ABP1FQ64_9CHLO
MAATKAPEYHPMQHTSDLLEHMEDDKPSTNGHSTKLAIYHEMGATHAKAGEHEAAEAAYSKAQMQCTRLIKDLQRTNVPGAAHISTLASCLKFTLGRLSNAWKLHQPALASKCISQAMEVLKQASLPFQQRLHMRRQDVLNGVKRRKKREGAKGIDAQSLMDYTHQLIIGHLELDKNDPGPETSQKEVTSLQAQVLRLLSQAYLLRGQAAHALACVQNLRKLQDSPDDAPGLCLTAIEALIQLDQLQEAHAKLVALVLHKDASAALCLTALSAAIQAPRCSPLRPAADMMLQRFAEDAAVPLSIVEALLETQEHQMISQERETLVLDIARNKEVLQLVKKADRDTRQQRKGMYMLLWDHAKQRFSSKDYKACEDFCTAALGYAEPDARADVARQLAKTKAAQLDIERAQKSPDTAADQDSSASKTISNESFALMQEEASQVLDRVRPLLNSDDASIDLNTVLDPELKRASHVMVQWHIWSMLWEEAIKVQGPSKRPGYDADIAVNLIHLVTALHEHVVEHAADDRKGQNKHMMYKELTTRFNEADNRLQIVGRRAFFRSGPEGAEAAEDSAMRAFMAGEGAETDAKELLTAATLYKTSASFLKFLPCTTPDHWEMLRTAYLRSISCMLGEYKKNPKSKACPHLAHTLREQALPALEAAIRLPMDPKELLNAKQAMFSLEFSLAMEEKRYGQLLPLMERAKAERLYEVHVLLQLAHQCLQKPPIPCKAAAKVAFSAALRLMLEQEPPPMVKMVKTMEEMYKISNNKQVVALLAVIGAYVRSMRTPSYPSDEISWLINETWSLGRKHAQAQRDAEAFPLMAAAISLMDLCDEFSDSKEMFEAEMEKVKEGGIGKTATAAI